MLTPEAVALTVFGLFGVAGLGGLLMSMRSGKKVKVRITRDGIIFLFALAAMVRGLALGEMEWFVGGGAVAGGIPVLRGTIDAAHDAKKEEA